MVGAVLVDQLDLCVADVFIDARPVFGSSGRSSVGTANGYFSKVVNEDCSLKDSGFAGKPSSRFSDKKLQMRGILATPTTPILDRWFRSMRNRLRFLAPQAPAAPACHG
jgi:hypothetical protein